MRPQHRQVATEKPKPKAKIMDRHDVPDEYSTFHIPIAHRGNQHSGELMFLADGSILKGEDGEPVDTLHHVRARLLVHMQLSGVPGGLRGAHMCSRGLRGQRGV